MGALEGAPSSQPHWGCARPRSRWASAPRSLDFAEGVCGGCSRGPHMREAGPWVPRGAGRARVSVPESATLAGKPSLALRLPIPALGPWPPGVREQQPVALGPPRPLHPWAGAACTPASQPPQGLGAPSASASALTCTQVPPKDKKGKCDQELRSGHKAGPELLAGRLVKTVPASGWLAGARRPVSRPHQVVKPSACTGDRPPPKRITVEALRRPRGLGKGLADLSTTRINTQETRKHLKVTFLLHP